MSTSTAAPAAPKAAPRSGYKSAPAAVNRHKVPLGAKSVQQKQQQQRPRGSLSSCSSSSPDLSGNEDSGEYHCSYYPDERRSSLNYSFSVFDQFSSDDESDAQKQIELNNNETTVRTEPAMVASVAVAGAQQPQMYHSRSISLVVNPNFDPSSVGELEAYPAAPQAPAPGSVKYKRGRNRFHYRQASHCPVVQREFKEADFLRLKQLKEELETSKLTEVESARLREIGFLLRQISDEFALDRRLTI